MEPSDDHYRLAAVDLYLDPGTIEVGNGSPKATVSRSEDGAYVQAWVYVPIEEAKRIARIQSGEIDH